ncbi:acyltransferase [Ancylostoma caninum]|uniref:Acyltransferase n=1 Tax=Ancylostoma caninum TaxID=29170 RepID=A0A368FVS3_ANCCA|nr:acyltransferase [Ancylostoma caninum]
MCSSASKTNHPEVSQKRKDIQVIRGWAITVVVLFHFFPSQFPNGYIGVDAFFVISGFLVAMILRKNDHLSASSIGIFYYRRMKRILPSYYLTLCSILTSTVLFLPLSYRQINMDSSRKAVLLISNFITNDDEQHYQKMLLGAEDLFVHTWSLCLEMQWYLIIPAIFVIQRLTTSWEKTFFAGIAGCSIVLYLRVDNTIAFYSVFTRLWQFLCGVAAFLAHDKRTPALSPREYRKSLQDGLEEKYSLGTPQNKTDKRAVDNGKWLHVAAIVIFIWEVMLSLIWFALPSHILRLATTVLTGAVVYIGSLQQIPLLGGGALAYLGDISYALYLFHWPVYVIVKPHSLEQPLGTFHTVKLFPRMKILSKYH